MNKKPRLTARQLGIVITDEFRKFTEKQKRQAYINVFLKTQGEDPQQPSRNRTLLNIFVETAGWGEEDLESLHAEANQRTASQKQTTAAS